MKLTSLAEELADHRFFQQLPVAVRARLAECANNVVFEPGAEIVSEGSAADTFLAVRSGRVAVGFRTPARGLAVTETLHGGDVLGWSWLFAPYRWQFDAIALERVHAVELHANCIRSYLDQNPGTGFDLVRDAARAMGEQLHAARLRLIDLYGPEPGESGES